MLLRLPRSRTPRRLNKRERAFLSPQRGNVARMQAVQVGATLASSWRIRAPVGTSLAAAYRIRATAGTSQVLGWKIGAARVGGLLLSAPRRLRLHQHVGVSLALSWSIWDLNYQQALEDLDPDLVLMLTGLGLASSIEPEPVAEPNKGLQIGPRTW